MLEIFLAPIAAPVAASPQVEAPAPIPPGVDRILSAALRLEDPAQLDSVIAAAKLAYPELASQIDQRVATLRQPATPLRVAAHVVVGTPPEPKKLSFLESADGTVTLDAAYTRGNTNTANVGARLKTSLMRQAQIHRVEGYINSGRASGTTIQRNWGLSYQLDRLWTEDIFGYIRGSHQGDEFLGFDYRTFLGAGAGYYFIQEDALSLRGEIGPGYRYSKMTESGEHDGDWVLYSAVETNWTLNDDWTLGHNSKVTWSEPTTTVSSTSQLSTALTETLRAGVSYEMQYEQNPPETSKNLDTLLKFNVSYGF